MLHSSSSALTSIRGSAPFIRKQTRRCRRRIRSLLSKRTSVETQGASLECTHVHAPAALRPPRSPARPLTRHPCALCPPLLHSHSSSPSDVSTRLWSEAKAREEKLVQIREDKRLAEEARFKLEYTFVPSMPTRRSPVKSVQ